MIGAFNRNMPFDQFTVEQLAGDLLPDATLEQQIASGYNRLLQTTEEGGAQPKEYRAMYLADRVRNVSAVWLGATIGCAQCHDHKFDPYLAKDFYSFARLLRRREGEAGRPPATRTTCPARASGRSLQSLEAEIDRLRKELDQTTPELEAAQPAWEKTLAGHAHAELDRARARRGRLRPSGTRP